ncbi:MAG: hypothetical protein ACI4XP_03665 [Acutalibacteraceae bacterium]
MAYNIDERAGQMQFYESILKRVDSELTYEEVLSDNNDGVINGNILEFKKSITDLNEHLFQAVKYLSARRIKGKPVPYNIHIIDLSTETDYMYISQDYLGEIERVYPGAASKGNCGFVGKGVKKIFHYSDDMNEAENLIAELKTKKWTKIHIDENCIIGWAENYYKTVPNSTKEYFIGDETGKHQSVGEIRNPRVFKEYIYPYKGKSNKKFKYLMDKLNDTMQKKQLGAFYTAAKYCEKSIELLLKAIDRVPEGNDYIIIDNSAGTGNLEEVLPDNILSHCVVSTLEYYEYKVLLERIGSKVRHIIPPFETKETFNAGLVTGADALSKEYIEYIQNLKAPDNDISYYNDDKCSIIVYINPPYAETTSVEHQKRGKGEEASTWKNSYVVTEMKKEVKGSALNDMGNAFIWSSFKYYLRQSTDSLIVYSPVKYWKAQHLINKKFIDGFAFNRKHFHTKINACIMCALWSNEDDYTTSSIRIRGFDIDEQNNLVDCGVMDVKKINATFSQKYYDKRKFDDDLQEGVLIGLDGLEKHNGKVRNKPKYNGNIIGYLIANTSGFDHPDLNSGLLIAGRYDGNGFYLRKDNYLAMLPQFCAARYITYNRKWTERGRIMKSADGAVRYFNDVKSGSLEQFLLKCLLFTCLEMQNHCRTITGSDGRIYRNELCFDDTNGNTLACIDIQKLNMNDREKVIMEQWQIILQEAKKCEEYDSKLTYGVFQIFAEIDTLYKDEEGNTHRKHIELHSAIQTLKALIKEYYNSEIVPTLFSYEFLK